MEEPTLRIVTQHCILCLQIHHNLSTHEYKFAEHGISKSIRPFHLKLNVWERKDLLYLKRQGESKIMQQDY